MSPCSITKSKRGEYLIQLRIGDVAVNDLLNVQGFTLQGKNDTLAFDKLLNCCIYYRAWRLYYMKAPTDRGRFTKNIYRMSLLFGHYSGIVEK